MTYDTWLGTCTLITQGTLSASYLDLEHGGYVIKESLTREGTAGHQMAVTINGGKPVTLVDRTRASTVCALHTQLNPQNAARYAEMPLYLALHFAEEALNEGQLVWQSTPAVAAP